MNNILKLSIFCLIFNYGHSAPNNSTPNKSTPNNPKATTMQKQASSPKIAYLHMHKVMSLDPRLLPTVSEEWQDLYKNIEKIIEPASKELETLREKFEKAKTEFESLQNSKLATKEALQKKYEEAGRLEMELRSRYEEREQFLQEELAKAQSVLTPKIQEAVTQIKNEQGWDLVLRGEVVLIDSEKFDITDDVLKILNSKYSTEKAEKEKSDKKADNKQISA